MSHEEAFRYDKMVEKALRGVVRQALEEVVETGLVDDHHFYITFFTNYPGVTLPDYLRDRYPGEMTIVLQHQFYDLEVDDEKFSVMLSFNNVPERLLIPLSAVTIFADPSVNFALQFQPLVEDDDEDGDISFEPEDLGEESDEPQKKGEVISLDSFRSGKRGKKARVKQEGDDADGDKEKDAKETKEKPAAKSKSKDKAKDKEKAKDKTKAKDKEKDKDKDKD